jgi:Holliday junction resolvase RusA-like endonuclease
VTALEFFIVCDPPKTTHHAKKVTKIGKFYRIGDKPELAEARQTLEALLLPFQPQSPVQGPVTLTVTYTWPWLIKHKPRDRAAGRVRKTSKPDLSNLIKTIEDRLVALRFIENDQSVAELHVQKWFGEKPGILIRIETLVSEVPLVIAARPDATLFPTGA